MKMTYIASNAIENLFKTIFTELYFRLRDCDTKLHPKISRLIIDLPTTFLSLIYSLSQTYDYITHCCLTTLLIDLEE